MRLLNAAVDHLGEDVRVVIKRQKQLLSLLHLSVAVLIELMRVVKEQVVLAGKFHTD